MATTDAFTTDPQVLLHVAKVNDLPVVDAVSDGNRTFVLCDRGAEIFDRWVTWSIWRNEHGRICAEGGHYLYALMPAVVDLYMRAGKLEAVEVEVERWKCL